MKKSILAIAVVLGATTTFAQDLTSKKGENYLPEAGDWAVSVDATPFLNYVGNFFGANGSNTAPTFNFLAGNNAIMGKYFVEEGMAYRAGINLMMGSMKSGNISADLSDSLYVPSETKSSASGVYLTGGMEWRKGSTRLQGFYGGELGIGFTGSNKNVFSYDQALAATDFGSRTLESKTGSTFMFGLRGFIGAEYFVLPKLAVGGEFGWGLGLTSYGATSTTTETADGTTLSTETTEGTKASSFGLGTDNMNSVFGPSGSLRISFHF